MIPTPPDLDPEEREFYALFGSLRAEVFELFDDLANLVLERVEKRQADEVRLQSPEPTDVVGFTLVDLINSLARAIKSDDSPIQKEPEEQDESENE